MNALTRPAANGEERKPLQQQPPCLGSEGATLTSSFFVCCALYSRSSSVFSSCLAATILKIPIEEKRPLTKKPFRRSLRSHSLVRICENACSTLDASRAEVSMNRRSFCPTGSKLDVVIHGNTNDALANSSAWSVETALKCLRSLLFPTSMITICESAWSLSSFNHRVTLSNVRGFEMSYTSKAPTAPR